MDSIFNRFGKYNSIHKQADREYSYFFQKFSAVYQLVASFVDNR